MRQYLIFQDENHKSDPIRKDWDALNWMEEFRNFLTGVIPDGIRMKHPPNLSDQQAGSVIWYLQEHMRVLPDNIEQCSFCHDLYNAWATGYYSEKLGKHYCSACDDSIDDGHNEEEN